MRLGIESFGKESKRMKKKRNCICHGVIVLFLFIDMFFFWNIVQDAMFVPNMQETTGIIVHVEEKVHNWDTGRICEFGYTVDGKYYRGKFIYLCKEISQELKLGKRIVVSYFKDFPENVRQGSVVRIFGIFVLKCSIFVLGNTLVFVGWTWRATLFWRRSYRIRIVALR